MAAFGGGSAMLCSQCGIGAGTVLALLAVLVLSVRSF
jgi:hypothetical protein